MGICSSSEKFCVEEDVVGRNTESLTFLQELCFGPSDLNCLFTAFRDIDADGSNTIRCDELFGYFRIDETPCNLKIFSFLNNEKELYLNFLEFCVVLWNFLTVDRNDYAHFVYVLYDSDSSGRIDSHEIIGMIETIHKNARSNPQTSQIISSLIAESRKEYSLEQFIKWFKVHMSLLNPLVTLQTRLRKSLISEEFWMNLENIRKEQLGHRNIAHLHLIAQETQKIKNNHLRQKYLDKIKKQREDDLKGVKNVKKAFANETLEKLHLVQSEDKKQPHKDITLDSNYVTSEDKYKAAIKELDEPVLNKAQIAKKEKREQEMQNKNTKSNKSPSKKKKSKVDSNDHDDDEYEEDVYEEPVAVVHRKPHNNKQKETNKEIPQETPAAVIQHHQNIAYADVMRVPTEKRRKKSIFTPNLTVKTTAKNDDKHKTNNDSKKNSNNSSSAKSKEGSSKKVSPG
jgi:hypothetical protein